MCSGNCGCKHDNTKLKSLGRLMAQQKLEAETAICMLSIITLNISNGNNDKAMEAANKLSEHFQANVARYNKTLQKVANMGLPKNP